MITKRIVSVFNAEGVLGVLRAIVRRIRMPHARLFPQMRSVVRDAVGLEIGGPSPIFDRGGLLPVYRLAARIDNCNFAASTIWEGDITEGASFVFAARRAPGRQYIAEGADLHMVPSESYDFLLSSHMIEHTANPLRALREWGRLLKPGGVLILVVPHLDGTFDHRRPVTTLAHLRDDYEQGRTESDLTHVPEILALHDAAKDPGTHGMSFEERAQRNPEMRSLHHHVFDTRLAVDAVSEAGFVPEAVEPLEPYHVVVLARKAGSERAPHRMSEDELRTALQQSPFRTDRAHS